MKSFGFWFKLFGGVFATLALVRLGRALFDIGLAAPFEAVVEFYRSAVDILFWPLVKMLEVWQVDLPDSYKDTIILTLVLSGALWRFGPRFGSWLLAMMVAGLIFVHLGLSLGTDDIVDEWPWILPVFISIGFFAVGVYDGFFKRPPNGISRDNTGWQSLRASRRILPLQIFIVYTAAAAFIAAGIHSA